MINIVLVGCGRVAQHYAYILNNCISDELVNVVGVLDSKPDLATDLATKLNTKIIESISDLDPSLVDLAIVLTPSGKHEEHSKLILERGISVLSEKPIGLLIENVEDNAHFAKSKSLQYGGVFQNRYNPAMIKAKKVIDSGEIGKIVSASVRLRWCRMQSYYEDGWHGTWKLDGGVSNQQAIHHIDALQWLIGMPDEISSFKGRQLNKLEAEDTFVACGVSNQNVFFTIEATTAARPIDFEASLSIVAENGYIEVGGVALNQLNRCFVINDEVNEAKYCNDNSLEIPNGYGLGHAGLISEIATKFIETGKVILPLGANESLNAVRFVHALYHASESKTVVQMSDHVRSKFLGV